MREAPLPRGPRSEAERPWRAASLTFAGSALILFFAYPRELSLTNVAWLGVWGQVVGMVGIVLALFMVTYPRAANVVGPFAIIAGIVGFPIMVGGVLAGSFSLVLGGALAFSWEPAPPDASARVSRSTLVLPLRAVAGLIDLVLLLVAIAIPAATFLNDPMRDYPAVTYLVEVLVWAAVFLPGAVRGNSPGKLLMRLRVWGPGGRPGLRIALIREAARASQFLVGIMLLPWIVHLPETAAIVMGVGVLATGAVSAHLGWTIHDRLAGTEVVALRVSLPAAALPAAATVALEVPFTRPDTAADSLEAPLPPMRVRASRNGRAELDPGRRRTRPVEDALGATKERPRTTVVAAGDARGAKKRRPRPTPPGQNGAVEGELRARDPARR